MESYKRVCRALEISSSATPNPIVADPLACITLDVRVDILGPTAPYKAVPKPSTICVVGAPPARALAELADQLLNQFTLRFLS
jgi:hypothetical protein